MKKSLRDKIVWALKVLLGALLYHDGKVLEAIEKFSWRAQRACGADCFRLADLAALVVAFSVGLPYMAQDGAIGGAVVVVCVLAPFWLINTVLAETQNSRGDTPARNWLGDVWFFTCSRIFMVSVGTFGGLIFDSRWDLAWQRALIEHALPLSVALHSYLVASTPLPPGPSRLGDWLRRHFIPAGRTHA